jgi:hypothetical protein
MALESYTSGERRTGGRAGAPIPGFNPARGGRAGIQIAGFYATRRVRTAIRPYPFADSLGRSGGGPTGAGSRREQHDDPCSTG